MSVNHIWTRRAVMICGGSGLLNLAMVGFVHLRHPSNATALGVALSLAFLAAVGIRATMVFGRGN